MKHMFNLLVFIATLCAASAFGQAYTPVTIVTPPALAPSAATNMSASTMFVGKTATVTLQVTGGLSNAIATVVGLAFTRSVDGSSYTSITTPEIVTVSLGSAAGAFSAIVTNMPANFISGAGYIKLAYITNAAAAGGTPTNFVLKASVKIP